MQERWNIRSIYLYLVCLVTLIMLIFGTAGLVRNVAELIYRQPALAAPMVTAVAPSGWIMIRTAGSRSKRCSASRTGVTVLSLVGNLALVGVAGAVPVSLAQGGRGRAGGGFDIRGKIAVMALKNQEGLPSGAGLRRELGLADALLPSVWGRLSGQASLSLSVAAGVAGQRSWWADPGSAGGCV